MESNYENLSDDEVMAWLENEGALEWVGMTNDGERLMSFNADRLQEIAPEMYDIMMEDIESSLLNLVDAGLVEVLYDEDLIPRFKISEEGRRIMREQGFEMDLEEYEGPNN